MALESGMDNNANRRGEPIEKTKEIHLKGPLKWTTPIGTTLIPKLSTQLIAFLHDNTNGFAWSPANMLDIPTDVITYHLNIYPTTKPVKQKGYHIFTKR